MKKILTIFFVTLGVIFFVLLMAAAYFYITDPLHLKPLFFGGDTSAPMATSTQTEAESREQAAPEAAGSVLSPAQESALEAVGIDPATVPSEITPEQEACFIEILGAARVAEIQAGAAPTPTEVFRARGCIE